LKTQSIDPKKLSGIEIIRPEIAAIFAENKDSLNNERTIFPTKTFAVIEMAYKITNFHAWWCAPLCLALNVNARLKLKLKDIDIAIPNTRDRTNIEEAIKNKLKNAKSIIVAIPPVKQNNANFEKCGCLIIFLTVFIKLRSSNIL